MVIALIVNGEGFPFSYETFDGNRADVSTLETVLRMVERKYGKARNASPIFRTISKSIIFLVIGNSRPIDCLDPKELNLSAELFWNQLPP
jgi:hypothetical protein